MTDIASSLTGSLVWLAVAIWGGIFAFQEVVRSLAYLANLGVSYQVVGRSLPTYTRFTRPVAIVDTSPLRI
jgi:hypothetical protein